VTTYFDLYKKGEKLLLATKNEEAALESKLLLLDTFNFSQTKFLAKLKLTITNKTRLNIFLSKIKQRQKKIPLAHILGNVHFRNNVYNIKPGVFIPRPETELLVEKITQVIHKNKLDPSETNFFEFGFGSGVISIEVALAYPHLKNMYAWDKSKKAYKTAHENAQRLGAQNINFIYKDFFKDWDFFKTIAQNEKLNIFVSNPPYIPDSHIRDLQTEVKKHDPKAALKGGDDGLKIYKRLFKLLKSVEGYFLFEFGIDQQEGLTQLLQKYGYANFTFSDDYSGIPRVLLIQNLRGQQKPESLEAT